MKARLYFIDCGFAEHVCIRKLVKALRSYGYTVCSDEFEPWILYVAIPDCDSAALKLQKAAFERCRVDHIERLV